MSKIFGCIQIISFCVSAAVFSQPRDTDPNPPPGTLIGRKTTVVERVGDVVYIKTWNDGPSHLLPPPRRPQPPFVDPRLNRSRDPRAEARVEPRGERIEIPLQSKSSKSKRSTNTAPGIPAAPKENSPNSGRMADRYGTVYVFSDSEGESPTHNAVKEKTLPQEKKAEPPPKFKTDANAAEDNRTERTKRVAKSTEETNADAPASPLQPLPGSAEKKMKSKAENKSESKSESSVPIATGTGTPGRVKSPYPPHRELDVTGLASGSLAKDPSTNQIFKIP